MYRVKVCFRLRKDLYEIVKILAKREGATIQEMVEDLLKIGYVRYVDGSVRNETIER